MLIVHYKNRLGFSFVTRGERKREAEARDARDPSSAPNARRCNHHRAFQNVVRMEHSGGGSRRHRLDLADQKTLLIGELLVVRPVL